MLDKNEEYLEVAVRMERHTINLYKSMVFCYFGTSAGTCFSRLILEKEIHLGKLIEFLKKYSVEKVQFEYPGEYEKYLQVTAKELLGHLSSKIQDGDAPLLNDGLSLLASVEIQKMIFYQELMTIIPEEKSSLDSIVIEIKNHLDLLSELK